MHTNLGGGEQEVASKLRDSIHLCNRGLGNGPAVCGKIACQAKVSSNILVTRARTCKPGHFASRAARPYITKRHTWTVRGSR